jgi:hypothetical protein
VAQFTTLARPLATDMFSDVDKNDVTALSIRKDAFSASVKGAINKARPVGTPDDVETQLREMVLDKSLSADVLAGLETVLATQREINKNVTTISPLSTGFAAFDLEAQAKQLFPIQTPLVNKIARKKGIGLAHRAKIVTGITGSGTGGNAVIHPGLAENATNTYGALTLNRAAQITQTATDLVVPYVSFGLGNSVTFDAQDSGIGFDDVRGFSVENTMYALKLMEERQFLYNRGTASGYNGALAAPTITLGVATAAGSQVALANATYYVYVTTDAGAFGQSVLSTVQSQATTAQVLTITVGAVAGAVGYNVYVGTTTGAANAHFVGRFTSLTGTLNGPTGPVLGDNMAFNTTGTLASTVVADTSAYAQGYDGIIPLILANSGNVNQINSVFNTSTPGSEIQAVFNSIYTAVKGDPDEIWMNGLDRLQLTKTIQAGGNVNNYKMELNGDGNGNFVGGLVMAGILNGITGKSVAITVHPWLAQGVAPVLSYQVNVPNSGVDSVWAAIDEQAYRGIQWPIIQRSYDNEVNSRGTFMCYAPSWNGAITGIKSA